MHGRAAESALASNAIPRSATRRSAEHGNESRPLSEWAELDAFVLLAEPGGGKSKAFESEAKATGGVFITARDFANLGPGEGWRRETLFIDGFDQMRADSASHDTPLNDIIKRLGELDRPRFRFSCREADWLQAVDQSALRAAAPGGSLELLHLDALTDEEVIELLRRRADRVPDALAFRDKAQRQSLDAMLRNPLLLNLLVDAVGDDWPKGRTQVYERACERMAAEHNEAVAAAMGARQPSVESVLDAAGFICAVLLLSGTDTVVTGPRTVDPRSEVSALSLRTILNARQIEAALSSKLFVADDARRLFLHRSIAEYLAARALGQRIAKHGLPISRVAALMCAHDGGVVEPLRGLNAWMSVTCPMYRSTLIDRDPLGCVLYGDVHAFDVSAKRRVLDGLRREAERFVWFRNGHWASHPFGALGSSDMAAEFAQHLASADRSPAHQSLLECVLEAIEHGEPQPALLLLLEAVVRDGSYRDDVRGNALDAWLAQSVRDQARALAWLDDIRDGAIDDARDGLCGRLLAALYPHTLDPAEVMKHFHPAKADNYFGTYRHFWSSQLLERTPRDALGVLADGVVASGITPDALRGIYEMPRFVGRVVCAALEAAEPGESIERIAKWLSIGIDQYGSAAIKGDDAQPIRDWLARHSEVQKRLLAHEFSQVQPDPQNGHYFFWNCREILYGAQRPRDWYRWLLKHAAGTRSPALAEHCFLEAAYTLLRPEPGFDIAMDDVAEWVSSNQPRWPQAPQWLQTAWFSPLDDQRGTQHRRQREYQAKQAIECARRRESIATHLKSIGEGLAPARLMHNFALAYLGRFTNVRGETPEDRVQEFLAGDATEAQHAIAGFEAALQRSDLPTVEEILSADLEQQSHVIREACLVGANLAHMRDAEAPLRWSDDLVRRLVAFRLTHGTDQGQGWYALLAGSRPQLVADVLGPYARQCLEQRAGMSITGLWPLARDDTQGALARLVVPGLLAVFPLRAKPAQLRRLNSELLPAAIRHLPATELRVLITQRLDMACLDSGQRIAWLLAGLHFAPHRRSGDLFRLVRTSRARTQRLAETIDAQSDHAKALPPLPAAAWGRLIEVLAPGASPEFPLEAEWIGASHRRRDLVRGMIDRLSASPDMTARDELERMRQLASLQAWRIALDAGRYEQARLARASRFEHASAAAVVASLSGAAPANALDLAALALQHLGDAQNRIRGGESNFLRTFWRTDSKGRPTPQVENACRDLLLTLLQPELARAGVDLNKEAQHANDTRADLRAQALVDGQLRVVPIEIKREDHKSVWTAWHDQLDGRYTTHPDAKGVGIYLVLWFGHRPRSDTTRTRPANALDMQERLNTLIPAADRARLSVLVLDLSPLTRPSTHGKRSNR